MTYCVHYLLQRASDNSPVRHVINEVPGTPPIEAEENARKWVDSQGLTYVETVRLVVTTT